MSAIWRRVAMPHRKNPVPPLKTPLKCPNYMELVGSKPLKNIYIYILVRLDHHPNEKKYCFLSVNIYIYMFMTIYWLVVQ